MSNVLTRPGVTPEDIAKARDHRDSLEARHSELTESAQTQLAAMKADAPDGKLPVTEEVIGKVEELFAEADKTGKDLDAARAHLARLQGQAFGRDPQDRMTATAQAERGFAPPTLGARFLAAEGVEEAFASRSVGRLKDIPLASLEETAAMIAPGNPTLSAIFDGSATVPVDQRLFPPVGIPERPVRLLDLITIGSTDSDTVHYTEEVLRDIDVADPGVGELLPWSEFEVEPRTVEVIDPGTVSAIPERTLEDQAQTRSWISGRLQRGVVRDAEDRIIAGSGVGNDFEGVLNRANIGTYDRGTVDPNESAADAIHRGITLVRVRYEDEPDAIVLRPELFESFLLEKNDYGYVNSGGPFGTIPQSLWGKRSVATTALDPDEAQAIVAFWREAHLWVRRGLVLREFAQHADYPRRRLVLLRVDWRAAFKLLQPRAFAVVDVSAPTTGGDPGEG